MNQNAFKLRVREVEQIVIFSVTRINYLLQLLDLISEKNRIIFRYQSFFAMVQRDVVSKLLIDVRRLTEANTKTHNLRTLVEALKSTDTYEIKKHDLDFFIVQIENLVEEEIAKNATIIASSSHAHLALKQPKKETVVKFVDLRDWFLLLADAINGVSGIFWSSSVVPQIPESEGDGFTKEMRNIEKMELAGIQLSRLEPEHEAFNYADRLLSEKQNN